MRVPVLLLATVLIGLLCVTWASSGPAAAPPTATDARTNADRDAPIPADSITAAREGTIERRQLDTSDARRQGARYRVHVVDRLQGTPLPGARVSYVDLADLERFRTEQGGTDDIETLAERLGRTVIADGQGLVRVPVCGSVALAGRSGKLYGETILRWEPGELPEVAAREHRLQLERDVTLRIRVVDHRGLPAANAPIEILRANAVSRAELDQALTVESDEHGLAWVEHWQVQLRNRQWGRASLVVRGRIPGATEPGVIIDPGELPEEILLPLPPTGRIAVRIVDSSGAPLPEYDLTLQALPGGETRCEAVPEVLGSREWTRAVRDSEPAVFEHVALQRAFRAQSRRDALRAVAVFSGPVVADQDTEVVIRAELESAVLVGRAEDRFGPIPDAELRFEYSTRTSRGSRLVRTDGAGRFRINLGHAAAQQRLKVGRFVLADSSVRAGMQYSLETLQLVPGELDVGNLVFQEAPILAAGRVLEDGVLSAATGFDLYVEREDTLEGASLWHRDGSAALRFPAPGHFEVLGVARSPRYRLRLESRKHLPLDPVEFSPGAGGVEIHLQKGGALRAAILAAEEIDTDDLVVDLVPREVPGRLPGQARTSEGELRRYRWDSLRAGAYRIEVKTRGVDAPLVTVPVTITAGERTTVDAIDVRDLLHVITVRILGPDGGPIPDDPENLVLVEEEWTADPDGYEIHSGIARIPTGRPFLDVLVRADGCRPERLRATPGDNVVAMQELPTVAIRLLGGLPPLPFGHAMAVRLTPDPESGAPAELVRVDETGTASVPFAGDGRHLIEVYVSRGDHFVGVAGVEPEAVQPGSGTAGRTFEIRVPRDALRETLAILSPR